MGDDLGQARSNLDHINALIDDLEIHLDQFDGEPGEFLGALSADLRTSWSTIDATLERIGHAAEERSEHASTRVARAVERLEAEAKAASASVEAELADTSEKFSAAAAHQSEAWREVVDRLRLQAALGRMEAQDRLGRVDDALEAARVHLETAQHAAGDTWTAIRDNGRAILNELRKAVREAAAQID
jgi:hypothetical protein